MAEAIPPRYHLCFLAVTLTAPVPGFFSPFSDISSWSRESQNEHVL